MTENSYKPRNYRIIRHITKNRILDIQDALEIGKLRIEIVEFAEGEGATLSVEHFAEPDALALICYDILQGRPWDKYVEYKGSVQGETAISRILVIERVEARNPVKITVSRGPGKVVGQGAIQPSGKPEASLSILLSEFDARRIALTILRHMVAYEAANYHARVAANTRQSLAEPGQLAEAAGDRESSSSNSLGVAPTPALQSDTEAERAATSLTACEQVSVNQSPQCLRRTLRPAVESYWMAAQRLGISRDEAEQILKEANGDWGQAWRVLRSCEERREQRA